MRYDVSVIGLYILDILGRPVSRIPERGNVDFIEEIRLTVAGTAGGTVIDTAKLGLKSLAVGAVGDDEKADWVLLTLEKHGADTSAMQRLAGIPTSATILNVRPNGDRPALHVRGASDHFDVPAFGAFCAYTVDGGSRGQIEIESFSADAMTVTFHGFNTHPGYAKGRMVNAIKVAAAFINALPHDGQSPETTSGHEGFVHPYVVHASVERTAVRVLVRDFTTAGLLTKERLLDRLAREAAAAWPGARVDTSIEESYRNLKDVLDQYPAVVEHAREAIRRAGLDPVDEAIRGGTDGCRLSFMGLPTPNLFAGEHNFHSRLEWVSRQDMEKAVDVIVALCRIWEERAPR